MAPTRALRWDVSANDDINKVPDPEKIKCCRCEKVKPPQAFSKIRMRDLKAHVLKERRARKPFHPAKDKHIPCTMCTGVQVTELTCCMCGKTKGTRTGFSKVQRRSPDKAVCKLRVKAREGRKPDKTLTLAQKCWVCMEQQLNTEPGGAESDDDDDDSSNDDCGSDGSDISEEYGSSSYVGGTAFSDRSVSGVPGGSSAGFSTPAPSSVSGGVQLPNDPDYVVQPRRTVGGGTRGTSSYYASSGFTMSTMTSALNSVNTSRAASTNGAPSSIALGGVGSSKYGTAHAARTRAPKAPASVASTADTVTTSGGGKFARIKAVPRKYEIDNIHKPHDSDEAADVDESGYVDDEDDDEEPVHTW